MLSKPKVKSKVFMHAAYLVAGKSFAMATKITAIVIIPKNVLIISRKSIHLFSQNAGVAERPKALVL